MEKRRTADKVVEAEGNREDGRKTIVKSSRIGILGGTFDPVHYGHINLALDARDEMDLDKVILVPARLQPFKQDRKTASGYDRLTMINMAIDGTDGLESSSCELDAEGVSYTYLTVRAMRRRFGEECRLYFITGTDSFLKIETWKNAGELLRSCGYLVGTRPGYRQKELEDCISRIRHDYNTEVRNIHNSQYDISSTEVRQRLESGRPCGDLIPEKVERYIRENGLYKK